MPLLPPEKFDYRNFAEQARPSDVDARIAQVRGDSQLSRAEQGDILTKLYKKKVQWQGTKSNPRSR